MAAKQVIVTRITRTRKSGTKQNTKSAGKGQRRCPTCGKYR